MNEITNFYNGTNVLITGASGFFGKVLIEKLLRTIKTIDLYLLIREKRNEDPQIRLNNLFHNTLFDKMKTIVPDYMSKVHLVEGDLSKIRLNLTETTENQLINNIDVVFHCGAMLNMLSTFKDITETNIRGTHELLNLCKKMKHLKSAMVVSTAFANCQYDIIEEKFYKPKIRPELLLKLSEEISEETFEILGKSLLGELPNTYCFSKNISENLISSENVPVGVLRPSIVTSTCQEPIPGWTDNVYGALGVYFAVFMGLIRVCLFKTSTNADIVPIDFCINALICAAWDVSQKKKNMIYNYTSTPEKVATWDRVNELFLKNYKYAFRQMKWMPFLIITNNKYLYYFLNITLHFLPAYFIDFTSVLLNRKPKILNYYKKMGKFNQVLWFFTQKSWKFQRENINLLWNNLSENAQNMYNFNYDVIDYDTYFYHIDLGLKRYFLKEDVSNLQQDALRLERYQKLHNIVKTFVLITLFVFIVKLYNKFL